MEIEQLQSEFTEDELGTIEFALSNLVDSIDKYEFEMSIQLEGCLELLEKVRKM